MSISNISQLSKSNLTKDECVAIGIGPRLTRKLMRKSQIIEYLDCPEGTLDQWLKDKKFPRPEKVHDMFGFKVFWMPEQIHEFKKSEIYQKWLIRRKPKKPITDRRKVQLCGHALERLSRIPE